MLLSSSLCIVVYISDDTQISALHKARLRITSYGGSFYHIQAFLITVEDWDVLCIWRMLLYHNFDKFIQLTTCWSHTLFKKKKKSTSYTYVYSPPLWSSSDQLFVSWKILSLEKCIHHWELTITFGRFDYGVPSIIVKLRLTYLVK